MFFFVKDLIKKIKTDEDKKEESVNSSPSDIVETNNDTCDDDVNHFEQ